MKPLYLLLAILCLPSFLHAENVSIHTELEQINEKMWYLQRDIGTFKVSVEKQQDQLNALDTALEKDQELLSERFIALHQEVVSQADNSSRMANGLDQLGAKLATLTAEINQQNNVILEQAAKIQALEKSLQDMRQERVSQQTDTGQELGAFRDQLSDVHSQLDTLDHVLGRQVESLGYWGAGIAFFFAIVLSFMVLTSRNRRAQN